jgi:hypothetical protein
VGCGCGGASSRSAAGQQRAGEQQQAGGAWQWEVSHNDGTVEKYDSEPEAMAALSFKGGGMRMIPRSG